jgi:hypothetical protein
MSATQTVQQVVNNLQGQITMWAIVAVVGLVAAIILAMYIVVKNWLRTKEGKIIDAAKGKRSHLLIAASLGPFAKLLKANDFNPEGILETIKFKDRLKKRMRRKIYNPPQKVNVDIESIKQEMDLSNSPTQDQLDTAELTRELIQKELDLTSEKVFLEGCRIPISVVVEDKVVFAGIKGLAATSFYQKLDKISKLGPKIDALVSDADFKDVGEALSQLYNRVSLVPFNLIRDYFDESYDQSNDESQKEYHYTMGYRDGAASKGKSSENQKLIMYASLAIGIAGIIGGAALAFVGK